MQAPAVPSRILRLTQLDNHAPVCTRLFQVVFPELGILLSRVQKLCSHDEERALRLVIIKMALRSKYCCLMQAQA